MATSDTELIERPTQRTSCGFSVDIAWLCMATADQLSGSATTGWLPWLRKMLHAMHGRKATICERVCILVVGAGRALVYKAAVLVEVVLLAVPFEHEIRGGLRGAGMCQRPWRKSG